MFERALRDIAAAVKRWPVAQQLAGVSTGESAISDRTRKIRSRSGEPPARSARSS